MLMMAAVLEGYGKPLVIRDIDIPPPGSGEVALRPHAAVRGLTRS
jgi:Zn-dependent alcohol dehydrogenase